MTRKNRTLFHLLFLSVFLAATLGVHFLHTEKSLDDKRPCPACHFQNSTFSTCVIHFFSPPQLVFLETLRAVELLPDREFFQPDFSTRGPPQA
jgi:hypothetical protein